MMISVRRMLLFLIVVFFPILAHGQDGRFVEGLAVTYNAANRSYGYIDKSGKWAIEPIFDKAYSFSEDVAVVQRGRYFGYIDKAGSWVIEPNFGHAGGFKNGLAPVRVTGGSGFIDKTGKIVIDAQYEKVKGFHEGIAVVSERCEHLDCVSTIIDSSGQTLTPEVFFDVGNFSMGLAWANTNQYFRYGYIDKSGKWVIPQKFDSAMQFSEGLAQVAFEGKFGFIDSSGNWVIQPKFDYIYASGFSEGLVRVKTQGDKSKIGFMDKVGRMVIEPAFFEAFDFQEGLAAVKIENRWGFIDRTGSIVIPAKYREVESFSEGVAKVVNEEGGHGYIDNSGKWVISPEVLKKNISQCRNVRCASDNKGAAL